MPATTNKPRRTAFARFETAIGACAIAWTDDAVVGTALPHADSGPAQLRWPDAEEAAPPPFVEYAIAAIIALLEGAPADLASIDLDMRAVSAFERQVYQAARAIPVGETVTYGELAASIGQPGAARAVGVALGRNPFPIVVPCHRILAAGGRSGGFTAPGGTDTKFRMLRIERAGGGTLFADLPLAIAPRSA